MPSGHLEIFALNMGKLSADNLNKFKSTILFWLLHNNVFLIDSAWVTGAWIISVYRAALHTMIDFMNFEVNG